VSYEEGKEKAMKYNMTYYETNKTQVDVITQIFSNLAKNIYIKQIEL
jgi:hypothetical protein